MSFGFATSGEKERAAQEAQHHKESQRVVQEQALKAKRKHPEVAEGDVRHQDVRTANPIPESMDGILTHRSLAIYELITNGVLSSDMVEPSPNVATIYKESLVNPDEGTVISVTALKNGEQPILYQCPVTVSLDDTACADTAQHQAVPLWWNQCSDQLKVACAADIPKGTTPSMYVS